jgi:hypothetical protein
MLRGAPKGRKAAPLIDRQHPEDIQSDSEVVVLVFLVDTGDTNLTLRVYELAGLGDGAIQT